MRISVHDVDGTSLRTEQSYILKVAGNFLYQLVKENLAQPFKTQIFHYTLYKMEITTYIALCCYVYYTKTHTIKHMCVCMVHIFT